MMSALQNFFVWSIRRKAYDDRFVIWYTVKLVPKSFTIGVKDLFEIS